MGQPQFFQTNLGRKFFEADVPKLVKGIDELAKHQGEANRLKQRELEMKEAELEMKQRELSLKERELNLLEEKLRRQIG